MSLVSGYASLLREQYAGTLGPGVDDALQGMLNGTERLRRYVDDLLDLQHARDPAEGTADLDAALAGAVEELRVFIERAKARVESGALGQAAVAPAKAERLFSHVVRGDPLRCAGVPHEIVSAETTFTSPRAKRGDIRDRV